MPPRRPAGRMRPSRAALRSAPVVLKPQYTIASRAVSSGLFSVVLAVVQRVDDLLVAFSCKNRAICPSRAGRRMANTAANLVDRVLPAVPIRRYVLSLPFELRALAAFKAPVLAIGGQHGISGIDPRGIVRAGLASCGSAMVLGHYVPRHIMSVLFPVPLCVTPTRSRGRSPMWAVTRL